MVVYKGAMFGLDARIALAIFAALTVISGAALESIMFTLRANKLIGYYSEIEKGVGSYLLDMGEDIPAHHVYTSYVLGNNLILNLSGSSRWKGPYLNSFKAWGYNHAYGVIKHVNASGSLTNQNDPASGVLLIELVDRADENLQPSVTSCSKGCSYWAFMRHPSYYLNAEAGPVFANYLDEHYDGGDGPSAGRFRWNDSTHKGYRLKLMPTLRKI